MSEEKKKRKTMNAIQYRVLRAMEDRDVGVDEALEKEGVRASTWRRWLRNWLFVERFEEVLRAKDFLKEGRVKQAAALEAKVRVEAAKKAGRVEEGEFKVPFGSEPQGRRQNSKFKIGEGGKVGGVMDMEALVKLARMQGELPGEGEVRSQKSE